MALEKWQDPNRRKAGQPRSGRRLVLVVDDDDMVRRVIVQGLRRLGYSVESVGSAADASTRISSGIMYDLIVTDVHLRDGLGPEAVAASITREAAPCVLVVSGSSDEATDEARRHLPSWIRSAVLPKPFSLKELQAAMESLLDVEDRGPEA
jgi:CheY-like chemotaxis protein